MENRFRVTQHAIGRFRERTGPKAGRLSIIYKLRNWSDKSREIYPTGETAVKMFTLHDPLTRFLRYQQFTLVISNGKIVTMFESNEKGWTEEPQLNVPINLAVAALRLKALPAS